MKFLSLAAFVALVGTAAAAIPNGQPCKTDGSMGNCESNFCLAKGDQVGKCQPKN